MAGNRYEFRSKLLPFDCWAGEEGLAIDVPLLVAPAASGEQVENAEETGAEEEWFITFGKPRAGDGRGTQHRSSLEERLAFFRPLLVPHPLTSTFNRALDRLLFYSPSHRVGILGGELRWSISQLFHRALCFRDVLLEFEECGRYG